MTNVTTCGDKSGLDVIEGSVVDRVEVIDVDDEDDDEDEDDRTIGVSEDIIEGAAEGCEKVEGPGIAEDDEISDDAEVGGDDAEPLITGVGSGCFFPGMKPLSSPGLP